MRPFNRFAFKVTLFIFLCLGCKTVQAGRKEIRNLLSVLPFANSELDVELDVVATNEIEHLDSIPELLEPEVNSGFQNSSAAYSSSSSQFIPKEKFCYATPPSSPKRALQLTPGRFKFDLDPENHKRNFTEEELKGFKVFVNQSGRLATVTHGELIGQYLYFLSLNDDLYFFPVSEALNEADGSVAYHSSFDDISQGSRSGNCKMAGESMILLPKDATSGQVKINHDSGHYKPPFEKVEYVVEALRALNFKGEIITTEEQW